MKNLFILIIILFAGCSVFENEQSIPLEYTGEWQWVASTGGIIGMNIEADSVDHTQSLEVFEQNKVKWYLNGELLQEYRGQKLKVDGDGEFLLKPVEHDDKYQMNRKILRLRNGSLIITDECTDCYTYRFRRTN